MPISVNTVMKSNNVVILFGSPRSDGHTHQAVQNLLQCFPDDCTVTLLCAYDLKIEPCTACDQCADNGVCPKNQWDDFQTIHALLSEASALVIASPIYFNSFPAPLKAIIDRFQQYYNKTSVDLPALTGLTILTSGSGDASQGLQASHTAAGLCFRSIGAECIGGIGIRNTDTKPVLCSFPVEPKELARRLFRERK